ncbi:hypothetical protein [Tahibacter amnicola]|uniref:Uncharacterized protein n=1 Tax=Tahibacter amnicola TaxID=2976241 RepID=A0ABY6BRX1_9GAMM|nr:hypothetical protein [Tahibacter amnicola]UXI70512.1 hypothetical protein N4264_13000 [Tahibacter amnicola]
MLQHTLLAAALTAAMMSPLASAQAIQWRVVAGEDGRVVANHLPAGTSRLFGDVLVGDAGGDLLGMRVSTPESAAGYWARHQGNWTRYTQANVTGALGPGRTGAEAGHVFLTVPTGGSGASPDGQRYFLARAGEPGNTASASYGQWRWDTSRNIEIARTLTDGILGPGLGANWVFPNSTSFASSIGMRNGQALLDGNVTSPTGASSHLIARHVPGEGNKPCLRSGATDALLAPGLVAGDSFNSSWLSSDLSVSSAGRVYGRFSATGSRAGIWEVCNGAPRAIAVDDETGARGPAIGVATAMFSSDIRTPHPGRGNTFSFFAYYRLAEGATSRFGLFWHDGVSNRPLAINDEAGTYGPHWENATWRTFDDASLSTAGDFAAFSAGVTTSDGGNPNGLWRVRTGGSPELVALIGLTGSYGPEPGRTWQSFGATAVLPTGEIIVEAVTDPSDQYGIWVLAPGQAPRRIFDLSVPIAVPTATGTVEAAVTSANLPNGGATFNRGIDTWIGADGTITFSPTVSTFGRVVLTGKASDRIFLGTFEP